MVAGYALTDTWRARGCAGKNEEDTLVFTRSFLPCGARPSPCHPPRWYCPQRSCHSAGLGLGWSIRSRSHRLQERENNLPRIFCPLSALSLTPTPTTGGLQWVWHTRFVERSLDISLPIVRPAARAHFPIDFPFLVWPRSPSRGGISSRRCLTLLFSLMGLSVPRHPTHENDRGCRVGSITHRPRLHQVPV